ncbi:hypothetical protein ACM26V_02735 [Salipaludibacillus sp. HK11]|uniref:hypothetical protein n=1 Tax=Salipaludibacillus sp. HK11 TaxID=3394320 RepID=UPI0039FBC07B
MKTFSVGRESFIDWNWTKCPEAGANPHHKRNVQNTENCYAQSLTSLLVIARLYNEYIVV